MAQDNRPLFSLTVDEFRELMRSCSANSPAIEMTSEPRYVYGYGGIAQLFGCSIPTAARIKQSGKIDKAIKQVGRKIIVDADLALELAGRTNRGRK